MSRKINLASLKIKIFIFYIISFFVVFGSTFVINFFVFDEYLKNAEIKKAETIAEMIAGNISALLQLDLKDDVKAEIIKQIDRNHNIIEIEVKESGQSSAIKAGYASSKKIKTSDHFLIEREIYDALGIQKLATVRVYYSKADFEEAKFFALRTLILLFGAALFM